MYNTTKYRNDDDYSAHRMKYYYEYCEEKDLLDGFIIQEYMVTIDNIDFLHYSVLLQLDNYNEIPQKVEKIYNLVKYFNSKDSKMFEAIFLENKNMNYNFFINCDTQNSLEQEIYRAKYEYILKLKQQNPIEKFNEISNDEISKIWKPDKLFLVVDGKDVSASVYYDTNDMKYYLSYANEVFKNIDSIEVLTTDMGNVKKIRCKDKIFKVKNESKRNKKDNEIYLYDNVEEIFNKLGAEVIFDYENEKMYITF